MKNKKKSSLTPKQKDIIKCSRIMSETLAKYGMEGKTPTKSIAYSMPPRYALLLDETKDLQYKQLIQYYSELIRQGKHGLPKNEIMSKNIIDISNWPIGKPDIYPENNALLAQWENEINQLSRQERLLFTIPCFKEGVLKQENIIHWTVQHIDLNKNQYTIHIQEYTDTEDYWGARMSGDFNVRADEEQGIEIQIIEDTVTSLTQIYRLLNFKSLGWSEFNVKLWDASAIHHAEIYEKHFRQGEGSLFHIMAKLFVRIIIRINMALYHNKATLADRVPRTTNKDHKIIADKQGGNLPERRTRTIDTLKFMSEKPPRKPTKQSVIRYTMESWACRGHMRQLKSGKIVYVNPSVHHRKALAGKQQEPINTTLILKG